MAMSSLFVFIFLLRHLFSVSCEVVPCPGPFRRIAYSPRAFKHLLAYTPHATPHTTARPPFASIRSVVEASRVPPVLHGSSSLPLSATISAATKEIIDLCDAHQSLRAARSLSLEGGGGAAGAAAEGEEVDRLAATASSLREAVDVLRRHTVEGGGDGGVAAVADDTVVAGRRAMGAVKELAGLLASEV